MREVLLVVGHDLSAMLRDRTLLVLAFVVPTVFAALTTGALGNISQASFATTLAVYEHGGDVLAERLEQAGGTARIEVVRATSAEEATAAVRQGDASGALLFDATRIVEGGGLTFVRGDDGDVRTEVAQAVAEEVASDLRVRRLAARTARELGFTGDDAQLLAAGASAGGASLVATGIGDAGRGGPAAYFGPAVGGIFVYLVLGLAIRNIAHERESGTLVRAMTTAPRGPLVLLAKVVSVFVVCALALATLWAASTLLFGVSWGPPVAVALLLASLAIGGFGIACLLGVTAPSIRHIELFTGGMTVVGAVAGGAFVRLHELPGPLRAVSKLLPNGSAMWGFTRLSEESAGVAAVLPDVLRAAGVGVALALVAAVMLSHRQVMIDA